MTARPRIPTAATAPRPWLGWVVAAGAFVAGLATDAIGAGQRVNVLALPLLGVMAWNLAVYGLLCARAIAGWRPPAPAVAVLPPMATGLPLAMLLHLAAAMLALGLVAGLYVRGLAFEYLAGWESTFLDAAAVHRLLGWVLGPASALTGIALPDVERLAAIRTGAGPGENAAPWIHLYATTAAGVVVLPRLALAAWSARAAAAGRAAAALRDGARAAGAADDGARLPALAPGARALALPFSFQLPPASAAGLASLVRSECGDGVRLSVSASLSPDAGDAPPVADPPPELAVAVFPLAATPEPQTHVAFAAALRARLPSRCAVAIVVDETAFRRRFAGQPVRIDERRAAWRTALAATGLPLRFAALGAAPEVAE